LSRKRSDRLKRIAEHFGGDRDLASRRLGELRVAMDQADERLQDLRNYLNAYHTEFEQVRRAGTSAATLQNYTAFLTQLQGALEQQQKHVENARAAFERQKDVWYQARNQVRAVEQAAERNVEAERRALDRSEQRQLDDLSLQRFLGGRR